MTRSRARWHLSAVALGLVAGAASCTAPGASSAVEAPPSTPLIRPDTPGNTRMFTFDAGEIVETLPSSGGHFLVHYTRAGADAVPLADVDASGVPDFVELVAKNFEDVYAHYQSMGFLAPVSDASLSDNGGDGSFDVYLVDFAGQGDGHFQTECSGGDTCPGYMILENDFKGYGYPSLNVAVQILASHEYFHAIQAAYDANQGAIIAEGTAVWGTETFNPALSDFEGFLPGYLDNTDRPLDQPINGATNPFSYGTALFFWFLEERYGDGIIRGLWEHCVNGANGAPDPQWFTILDGYLQGAAQVSFADAFVEFSTWNLYTKTHADATKSYAAGGGYAPVKMTAVAAPYTDSALRLYHSSAQYYRVDLGGRSSVSAELVSKTAGDTDGLALLFAVEADGQYASVTRVADLGAPPAIDVTGASSFVVVAINTLQTGESLKPGLCIGTPDEIAACKAGIQGAGAGGGGAGGSGSDGSGGGCSCSVPADGSAGLASWALITLMGLVYARRARRAR